MAFLSFLGPSGRPKPLREGQLLHTGEATGLPSLFQWVVARIMDFLYPEKQLRHLRLYNYFASLPQSSLPVVLKGQVH